MAIRIKGPKSRAAKAGLIALEIVGVLIAAAAALGAFVIWRLEAGPVSLGPLKESAAFAIERALPAGHDASVAEAVLAKNAENGVYDLILEGVVIRGPANENVGDLSRIAFSFSPADMLRGAAGPRRIVVTNPVLRIERGADRRISLDYAAPKTGKRNLFQMLTGGRYFREAFESAELINAQVHFVDEASGRAWRADGAEARIYRTPEGYAARLDGAFDIDGSPASLKLDAEYAEGSEIISANLQFADAPVGDVLSMFYGPNAEILSAPLSGNAAITLSEAGKVISSRIDARAGAGILTFAGSRADVTFIELSAGFDPGKNEFDLQRFGFEIGASRGEFRGKAAVQFAQSSLWPATVEFDLTGENIVVGGDGFLPQPLPIEKTSATGDYNIDARKLTLTDVRAELLGVSAGGSVSFAKPNIIASPEIKADIRVDGALDPERVLRAWPLNASDGARDFVATRMPKGFVENIALKMDLPAGAVVPDRPMPDEALALTFDVKDATAIYSPGMTPLTNASGSARLTGNRFVADIPSGRIGSIALTKGDVEFTALSPRGEPVHFRFTANGAAKDILTVLDQQPLELLKATPLEPARFSGNATARVDITRPNVREAPREDYGYSGTATFEDLTIAEFYEGTDLNALTGRIDLLSKSMRFSATAEFGGAPVVIDWTQKFYAAEGPSKFRVSGTVNSATGDIFGIPTRNLVRGPVPFSAEAVGQLGKIDSLSLTADFTNAELMVEPFGWAKAQGTPANGALDLAFTEGGVDVRDVKLTGEGVEIDGSARLAAGGAIEQASFERFFLDGGADFSVTANRLENGPLDIALTGAFLNAGPFVESVVAAKPRVEGEDKSIDWGRGMFVRGRIDELALRSGSTYRDASLDFRHSGERLEALEFSARTTEGAPLSMVLRETGADQGAKRAVATRTDDIGALFTGIFGVSSLRGGEGSMEILVNPRIEGEPQGLTGVIEARGIHVVRAPLLARIFSAGSLTGLSDLVNGEGIDLSDASAEFRFHKGVLFIKEARASGPAVGITASGEVAAGSEGGISLNGAVAPAYQVNSLLGKAPVIGDLFVNREGEGIVALAYQVTGPASAPTITVNPLSAFAPGFLRRMFEPNAFAPGTPPAEEAPETAPPSEN